MTFMPRSKPRRREAISEARRSESSPICQVPWPRMGSLSLDGRVVVGMEVMGSIFYGRKGCAAQRTYNGTVQLGRHRMNLAFSTNAFTRFSLLEALRAIKGAGYAGVEILADVPHAWPPTLDERQVAEIRRELEKLNLAVSNVNANCSFGYWKDAPPEAYFEPSLISPNAKHRADRLQLILKTLGFAKAVGAENISITSGK